MYMCTVLIFKNRKHANTNYWDTKSFSRCLIVEKSTFRCAKYTVELTPVRLLIFMTN